MVFRSMDTPTLSTRCISDYEVLQDQRQLAVTALGWSLHCKAGVSSFGDLSQGQVGSWTKRRPIWIKDPLAILADGAERGVVVRGGKIVELVPRGREPATADAAVYDAGAHVVAARADQHPSSFLPDADAGAAGGARSRTVSVAAGALSGLGAADAGIAASWRHRGDVGIAAVGLHHHDRPSLRASGRA